MNDKLHFFGQVKIVICGNHEDELTRLHSSQHITSNILTNATHYLHHEAISLFDDSIRIFGSPFSRFGPATALQHDELSDKWREIPVRILFTFRYFVTTIFLVFCHRIDVIFS
jgi:hypothetical protein